MSKTRSATITTTDKNADKNAEEGKAVDISGKEEAAQQDVQSAQRRPVRGAKGRGGAANERSGKANTGNRTGRGAREQGANDVPGDQKDEDEDEELTEEEKAKKDEAFWTHIVSASYRSRLGRGEWGDGEG